jgi:hypothetical protein
VEWRQFETVQQIAMRMSTRFPTSSDLALRYGPAGDDSVKLTFEPARAQAPQAARIRDAPSMEIWELLSSSPSCSALIAMPVTSMTGVL